MSARVFAWLRRSGALMALVMISIGVHAPSAWAGASTTTLASSANPSTNGQSVTFTATVKGTMPTGTVTFKDGTTTLGTGTLSGTGNTRTATLATAALAMGTHSITAAYGGNSGNTASTSAALTQTVNKANTTTTVASSANPSATGQSVTFTATVTGFNPTGTVTFKDGTTTLGTGTLAGAGNSRTATFATSTLSIASHSITAAYAGDGGNNTSTSAALAQVVNKAVTTTGLVSSANPSSSGQSVTFTATVTGVNPTGTVTFKDGATTLGTGALSGTGNSRTATFATSTLSVASHSITASYAGDASNGLSTSSALAQAVVNATTTALASSANPSTAGQSVTFTATITGINPTGTVTFKDGTTTLGTGTLAGAGNSRTATLVISTLSAGSHSITASYGGDASNAVSTSAAVSQSVVGVTTTSVASSANPSASGAAVTFTATVVGVNPTGTVTFKDGATTLGTGTLSGTGNTRTATFATSTLASGTHSITAGYGGDAGNTTSTSAALSQAVSAAGPDLTVSNLVVGSIVANQNGTWTIPVSFTVSNIGTAPAQAGWYDRCWLSSDAVLSSNDAEMAYTGHGTNLAPGANYNVSMNCIAAQSNAPGSYTLFVKADGNYPLDNGYVVEIDETNNSAFTTVVLIASASSTTTVLSSTVNPVVINQNTTLRATITPASATGTVTFKDSGNVLGSAPVSGGVATLAASFATVGTRSLTGEYSGDTSLWPSTSATYSQTVGAAPSSAALSASPAQALVNQTVVLNATVSGIHPSGSVTFKDGGTTLGSAAISGGTASFSVTFTASGPHNLTAMYNGDTNNLAATSNSVTVEIYTDSIPTGPMTWNYGYDANGNARYAKDPNGNITDREFDSLNRVAVIRQPAPGAGGTRPSIAYGYDARGQLTSVTDPRSLVTAYTVDGLGNTSVSASPDSGSTNATFDAAGNVLTRTDARGKLTTYGYDSLNRVTSIAFVTGVPITFEYDGGAVPVANSIGKLTRITDESGSTSYTHDAFGRVATKTQVVGSGPGAKTFTVGYTWGTSGAANGKLIAITYPSGSRINLGYDAAGRTASLSLNPANANGSGTNLGTTVPLVNAAAYNGANDLLGWSWGDGNVYQRSFDGQGRLKTYPLAGTQRTLAYDNALGIVGFTHAQGGNAQPALDQGFTYDALDRLVSANVAGTTAGYGYDATGNRTSRVVGASSYSNSIAAGSNRLATVQGPGQSGTVTNTYVHDNAGNLTSDGNATYGYSDRGRMNSATVAAGSVSYLVNGLEQRVMKSGPTSLVATGAMYYVHDEQGRLLGQYDANLTAMHETAYFGDTPVAVLKSTGSAQSGTLQVNANYVYADQINTPRVITRASDQAIVWRWDQAEAFGAAAPQDNPSGLGSFTFDQRFPGQVFDAETGNHDNWHRTYQASVGRYVQSDPIGLKGGFNTYAYVDASPLSFVDPKGLLRCRWVGPVLECQWDTPAPAYPDLPPFAQPDLPATPGWKWPELLPDSWADKIREWCTPKTYSCTTKCQSNGSPRGAYYVSATSNLSCSDATQRVKASIPRGEYPRHCSCADTTGFRGTGHQCE